MHIKHDERQKSNPPKVPYFAPIQRETKIQPVFVGEQQGDLYIFILVTFLRVRFFKYLIVTRTKSRFYDYYGIKECFIGLQKCYQAEALVWLHGTDANESTDPKNVGAPIRPPLRRNSVIGHGLYSVNNRVLEKATDFLEKVPRMENLMLSNETTVIDVEPSEPSCSSPDAIVPAGKNDGQMKSVPALMKISVGENGANEAPGINEQPSCSTTMNIAPANIAFGRMKNVTALLKITQVGESGSKESVEYNDFCPFRRLPNVPFAINGRPRGRSKSMDTYKPSLETVFESEHERTQDMNIVRKWVGTSNF